MAQNDKDQTDQDLTKYQSPTALIVTLIVSLLVFICAILVGCYFVVTNISTLFFNFTSDSIMDFTGNHISGSVDLKNESNSPWWILMPFAIIVCAIAFILSKIISVLRDLIENEQVNYRYTQKQ